MMKRKLLLIQTGHASILSEALVERYGDYDAWFRRAIGTNKLPKENIHVVSVIDGELLPPIEEIEKTYSGIIITGSPAYVTDKLPWSVEAGNKLKQLADRNRLFILGVCYGHQLLCDCLGGVVKDNPNGSTFGTQKITLSKDGIQNDPLFSIFKNKCEIYGHVSHRQSVIRPPENTQVLGSNLVDPNHIIRFREKTWGVQFHPEFNMELATAHVTLREKAIKSNLGTDKYEQFLKSIRETDAGDLVLARFVELTSKL